MFVSIQSDQNNGFEDILKMGGVTTEKSCFMTRKKIFGAAYLHQKTAPF